jgi:serine/threonine-protein kinase
VLQSIAYFERALETDHEFALAWAGLADACTILADYGLTNPAVAMPRAREAAQRALCLNPSLAEAHASLGLIRGVYDWAWDDSERHFRQAMALNPGYATAYHWYGADCLALFGRFEEAIEMVNIALRLNPLEPIFRETLGHIHMLSRRYGMAEVIFHELHQELPNYFKACTALGRVFAASGRFDEAIAMFEKGRAIGGDVPSIVSALGQVHGYKGDFHIAQHYMRLLQAIEKSQHVPSTCFAVVHLGLGETGRALDWLERGCANHELPVTAIGVHPAYERLRAEQRFRSLLTKMNIAHS